MTKFYAESLLNHFLWILHSLQYMVIIDMSSGFSAIGCVASCRRVELSSAIVKYTTILSG